MPKRTGHGIELLADETRRRIIGRLAAHPYRPSTLAAELGLARSTVSHHLRLLHEAGLIRILAVWNDGRYTLYGIDHRAHGRITAWLAGTDVGRPHAGRADQTDDWSAGMAGARDQPDD